MSSLDTGQRVSDQGKVTTMTPSIPKLTAQLTADPPASIAAPAEWLRFQRLRERYQQAGDLWSARELAHLLFLRWLVQTGRLVP